MTQDERLIELEAYVKAQGKVTLDFICQRYQISSDSARRDLVKLTQRPGMIRIRGGAIYSDRPPVLTYSERESFDPIKEQLAKHAATLIHDNDILFLDAGTTTTTLAKHLDRPLHVITNSIEVLSELREKKQIRKCLLGGEFDDFTHAILGLTTIAQIKNYVADKAIIGVSALSDSGITANTEADALLKKAMAAQSKLVICITSHQKFNTQLMYHAIGWAEIDYLITDKMPPEDICKQIQHYQVELIVKQNTALEVNTAI